MASSDVLLHAGNQETFGLVVLEAMAQACAVAAFAAGGVGEQVEHAIATGFAFLSRNWLAGLVAVAILFVAYVAWGRKAEPQPNWPK